MFGFINASMTTTNRNLLVGCTLAAACVWAGVGRAVEPDSAKFRLEPDKNIIPAPADPAEWPAFREALDQWRDETRARLKYDGTLYDRPEFAWSTGNFSCCFLMLCDQTFYDAASGRYTVDAFLDHGLREFGGYDSVVLWHAYPRIGVDERNQFDFYRDVPGGLPGLRDVVHQLQRRGVKVYIDYNPWDTGTRREDKPDLEALVDLVQALDVDGIFLDTMARGAAEFRARLDAVRPGVILEGEGAVPLENIYDHHASWAQWFSDSDVPGVLRHKWLERRHMQHQIKRWDYDHSGELQSAWMNGSGMMVWENVFGSWVPWNARDRSTLRSMLSIQRRYRAIFCGEDWTPLVPCQQPGVYASLWQGQGLRIWTLVNRHAEPARGELLRVPDLPEVRYYDLVAGRLVEAPAATGVAALSGTIPARGVGCFVAGTDTNLGEDFQAFLRQQAERIARAEQDVTTPRRETRLRPAAPCKPLAQVPAGMVEIPAADVHLRIEMRARECGFFDSMPPAEHGFASSYQFQVGQFRRRVSLPRFAIDETPVTNARFAEFFQATAYRPQHPENFLRHWTDGKPPAGKEDHPVVYVDLDDARAYAVWAGKRLPTEEEWQYAAQGPNALKYPWGNELAANRANGGEAGGTTPVTAFPAGRSPFGCYDMCGNVWQWTESERSDGRTRFCILRGGSYFAAQGSNWYVDGGPRPTDFATKFLLMWPGLDRCSTIGFRCAVDLEPAGNGK
jgi:formylglycine-generating enzyme required for sulfatase activity